MKPQLRKLVDEINAYKPNPPTDSVNKPGTLVFELVQRGLDRSFSERDIETALLDLGVDPDDIPGWMESLASWV
jgi:hypothetical protein